MNDSDVYHLEELAQEFVERLRSGESPTIEDFVSRCPEHAEEIRELFPALHIMEKAVPDSSIDSSRITDPMVPTVPFDLGDYRVLREVGRGGMGVVYEAEQQALGRRVALKVLSGAAARKPNSLIRFQREARSAGRLHHTNIVPVHDIGFEKGIHFYTMQLIEGASLDQVITELAKAKRAELNTMVVDQTSTDEATHSATVQIAHSLLNVELPDKGSKPSGTVSKKSSVEQPVFVDTSSSKTSASTIRVSMGRLRNSPSKLHIRNAAYIGLQAAEALAYAHAQRILHRDVKPANVMLDLKGNVWITDFGLARQEDQALTASGDLVGTLKYMAPERFQGQIDARGDVYSLGLTLYELLTLRSCLPRTDRIPRNDPRTLPAPRECDPSIPYDLETIVMKAIEHDPKQRYATAIDLADDLRRFLTDRPILARPITRLERAWMWVRRNPRESTWLAALVLTLIALACGTLFTFFLREERDRARTAERSALSAEQAANLAKREATIRGLLSQAIVEQKSEQPGLRGRALANIRHAATLHPSGSLRHDLQRVAVTALATQDVRFERVPGRFDFWGDSMALDFANRYLAHVTSDGTLVLRNAQDYSEVRRIEAESFSSIRHLQFSEHSQFLLVRSQLNTSVWRVEDGSLVFKVPNLDCLGFDISRDESWIAVCRKNQRIDLVDLNDTTNIRTIENLDRAADFVAFSPDGLRLLVGYKKGSRRSEIFDLLTLKRSMILSRAPYGILALAWHPDGKRVAFAAGSSVEIWDSVEGGLVLRLIGHTQVVDQVEFHPSLPLLRTFCWDGMSRLWDIRTGRLVATFVDLLRARSWDRQGQILGYRFSPDYVDVVQAEPVDVFRSMDVESNSSTRIFTKSTVSTGRLQGRFVATTNQKSLVICSSSTLRTLANVRPVNPFFAKFDPHRDCLWVASHEGLSKLPVRIDNQEVTIGPPSHRLFSNDWHAAEISTSSETFAAINDTKRVIDVWNLGTWENQSSDTTRFTIPLPKNHNFLAMSPDGHWCATTYWHDKNVLIWDLQQGTLAHEMTTGIQTFASFTSDSKFLVTSRLDAFQAYDVQGWKPAFSIPRVGCAFAGQIAFSNNGKIAAAETEPGVLDLIELATRSRLLRLQLPVRPSGIYSLSFTADDTELQEVTFEPSQVGLWDFRKIKDQLRDIGLDWDSRLDALLDTRTTKNGDPIAREELTLNLVGVDNWQKPSTIARMNHEQAIQAISNAEQSYSRTLDSADAKNALARVLLMAPKELRELDRAHDLATAAIVASPDEPYFINTLALAQLRLGQPDWAVQTIRTRQHLQVDNTLPFALYILVLSLHLQGQYDEARTYLAWAERAETASLYALEDEIADRDAFAEEVRAALTANP